MNRSYPRDFFIYLLMIVTLYVTTFGVIALLFQYVNIAFEDVLSWSIQSTLSSIRWHSSMIIIMFPVFLACSILLEKSMRKFPEVGEYRVRRWLLFFTLFLTSVAIIGDLVSLVYSFMSGELTVRFLLKVVIVLAVASAVFAYYLWDVRREKYEKTSFQKLYAIVAAALVVVIVGVGFYMVGSPATQRRIRLDEQRVSDLQSIQYQVLYYWQSKEALPNNLQELADPLMGYSLPLDPVTGASYEFEATGDLSFNLCATFDAATPFVDSSGVVKPRPVTAPYGGGMPIDESWIHPEGYHCFERTIDPDFYKPRA